MINRLVMEETLINNLIIEVPISYLYQIVCAVFESRYDTGEIASVYVMMAIYRSRDKVMHTAIHFTTTVNINW